MRGAKGLHRLFSHCAACWLVRSQQALGEGLPFVSPSLASVNVQIRHHRLLQLRPLRLLERFLPLLQEPTQRQWLAEGQSGQQMLDYGRGLHSGDFARVGLPGEGNLLTSPALSPLDSPLEPLHLLRLCVRQLLRHVAAVLYLRAGVASR